MRTPILEDAIALAAEAHRGQLDKGGEPYILHPLRVMGLVPPGDARIVAVLHDVVEDTVVTLDRLRALGYPGHVVRAIDHLSRRPGEQYFDFVRRTLEDPLAVVVKRADLTDNMRPDRLRAMGAGAASMRRKYDKALAMIDGEARGAD